MREWLEEQLFDTLQSGIEVVDWIWDHVGIVVVKIGFLILGIFLLPILIVLFAIGLIVRIIRRFV